MNNNIPVYILGDFNCSHTHFGNRHNNTVGNSIAGLINQGKLMHIGPHFPTFIRQGTATNPDKVFTNKHCYHNTHLEPGNVTSSDHLPIILKISTKPFYHKQKETYQFHKADWDYFKNILENNIEVTTLNNYTPAQIENEVNKWLITVKTAMEKSIPRSTYRPTYQTPSTPQIRTLEREFNELSKNAQTHGWTINNYREYIRIRQDLREECKREHNKRWEQSIDQTIERVHGTGQQKERRKKMVSRKVKNDKRVETFHSKELKS